MCVVFGSIFSMKTAFEFLDEIERQAHEWGFTMAELCREAGMQQSLVSRWRSRDYEPRLSSLLKLSQALNTLICKKDPTVDSIENLL